MRRDCADHVAWVTVERDERDPQRFWLAVVEKLRTAVGADAFVEKLTPAPEFDGEAVVERLISELRLARRAGAARHRRPARAARPRRRSPSSNSCSTAGLRLLRVVLATRRDPQLGLHRLRLAGELTEVRAADLRFTLDETRELLAASGIASPDEAIVTLHARTEGWAAGLRLAALSLAGHPDPERFVAEFSGSERTVADYLLAEVLAARAGRRAPAPAAHVDPGAGERTAGRSSSSTPPGPSGSCSSSSRRTPSSSPSTPSGRGSAITSSSPTCCASSSAAPNPSAVAGLHQAAAAWLEEHGLLVDAIRHAQAAADWRYAARLVADHGFSLSLDGQDATMHALLAAFPESALSDPELARAFCL